ncbi:MAG: hypothetical protein JWR44_927 [Hymenobacter sp.]|jgi:hypothetical protein|nr:hypothetical protein [Hymenobacter sp.]
MEGRERLNYNHTSFPCGGTDKPDKLNSRYFDVSIEPRYPFGYGLS